VVGLCAVLLVAAVALLAPLLAPYAYDDQDWSAFLRGPEPDHLLGTDELGRDVLSRMLFGARVSMTVGFVAQAIIVAIGVPLGLASGYFGGWVDALIMRLVEILYAFPSLLLVILVASYLKGLAGAKPTGLLGVLVGADAATGGLIAVFIALGVGYWLSVCRLVRGQVLSLKQREYILAARCIGAGPRRIIFTHLLPNTFAPILVAVALGVPSAMMIEAGLSFLGLGVNPPMPSWGGMVADGVRTINSAPHLLLAPTLAISLALLAFNFLGDGLRDALDPSMRGA
jgi:ABC-type dipeptide/oligopeptide/nickel transport system permease subunit